MRWISLKDISIGIDCNSNQNDTGCFKSEAEVVGHCYSYSGCQKKKEKANSADSSKSLEFGCRSESVPKLCENTLDFRAKINCKMFTAWYKNGLPLYFISPSEFFS